MLRIVIIALLASVRLIFGCPSWLAEPGLTYRCFLLYSFFHASWWHLAANSLAVWVMFAPRRRQSLKDCALCYVIAILVYPFSALPPVGLSNFLYATIGLRTPSFSSQWWRSTPVVLFLMVTFAMLLLPQISALTHILSLLAGILCSSARRLNDRLNRDVRDIVR